MNGDWWWHVFHDPMNENPWSFAAAVITVSGSLAAMYAMEAWRSRRRRRKWEQHD